MPSLITAQRAVSTAEERQTKKCEAMAKKCVGTSTTGWHDNPTTASGNFMNNADGSLTDAQFRAELERCVYCEEKPCQEACPGHLRFATEQYWTPRSNPAISTISSMSRC